MNHICFFKLRTVHNCFIECEKKFDAAPNKISLLKRFFSEATTVVTNCETGDLKDLQTRFRQLKELQADGLILMKKYEKCCATQQKIVIVSSVSLNSMDSSEVQVFAKEFNNAVQAKLNVILDEELYVRQMNKILAELKSSKLQGKEQAQKLGDYAGIVIGLQKIDPTLRIPHLSMKKVCLAGLKMPVINQLFKLLVDVEVWDVEGANLTSDEKELLDIQVKLCKLSREVALGSNIKMEERKDLEEKKAQLKELMVQFKNKWKKESQCFAIPYKSLVFRFHGEEYTSTKLDASEYTSCVISNAFKGNFKNEEKNEIDFSILLEELYDGREDFCYFDSTIFKTICAYLANDSIPDFSSWNAEQIHSLFMLENYFYANKTSSLGEACFKQLQFGGCLENGLSISTLVLKPNQHESLFPYVTKLKIVPSKGFPLKSDSQMNDFIKQFPKLTAIDFSGFTELTEGMCVSAIKQCEKIEYVNLQDVTKITTKTIEALIHKAEYLKVISLSATKQMDKDALIKLFSCSKNLESVDLNFPLGFEGFNEIFVALTKCCPKLNSLKIQCARHYNEIVSLSNEDIQYFGQCSNLQLIDFNYIRMTPETYRKLLDLCPNLISLKLALNTLTNDDFLILPEKCMKIQHYEIEAWTRFTVQEIEKVIVGCPELRILYLARSLQSAEECEFLVKKYPHLKVIRSVRLDGDLGYEPEVHTGAKFGKE